MISEENLDVDAARDSLTIAKKRLDFIKYMREQGLLSEDSSLQGEIFQTSNVTTSKLSREVLNTKQGILIRSVEQRIDESGAVESESVRYQGELLSKEGKVIYVDSTRTTIFSNITFHSYEAIVCEGKEISLLHENSDLHGQIQARYENEKSLLNENVKN